MTPSVPQPVTLDNCDQEPIHIPGAIQPHGAMLALRMDGTVLAHSDNFAEVTGVQVAPGVLLETLQLGPLIQELFAEACDTGAPWTNSVETLVGEGLFDVVGHIHLDVCFLEFEPRGSGIASFTKFALYAQRIISQVQLRDDVDVLLSSVTNEIRKMTGYDRVMAYRFRPDLSGEVVAEAKREDLESFLGQRYPASDIPAQARRLYIQNPIRMIANVNYQSSRLVPGINPDTGFPFDLSYSTLRSVSPIHCEYLSNMGVRASMSVSIVVAGKLWGLFACHHMSPKSLAHPVRMSFQVCSHVCSAMVERLEANRLNELTHQGTENRLALVRQVRESEDMVASLGAKALNVASLLPCDGAAVMLAGRMHSVDGEFAQLAEEIIDMLQATDKDVFQTDKWPHAQGNSAGSPYCGVLAIRFHRPHSGWVIWFRLEQVNKIKWGGKPEKSLEVGPSGPRLTPRGSFEAWEEVVRGRSAPWSETDMSIAEKLRLDLVELCLNRATEIDRMRQRLIAVLGHDLRTPLQSISMAASMLSQQGPHASQLQEHINYSSSRMERLITQILEMSRLQAGSGISVTPVQTDISSLMKNIVRETNVAYPGFEIQLELADNVVGHVDPDRYAQVAVNLLSNARHHKVHGTPVEVVLSADEQYVRLSVANEANRLSDDQLATLFVPFKQQSSSSERNKTGLGIGLYIASAIAEAHGGKIEVQQEDGRISFCLMVPTSVRM